MHLQQQKIIEIYDYKNKSIVCQIRVKPRLIKHYHGQQNSQKSYRWLQTEHWARFEEELETLLTEQDWCASEPQMREQFLIDPCVQIRIENARTSLDTFHDLFKGLKLRDVKLFLKCTIQYKEPIGWERPKKTQNGKCLSINCSDKESEYEPQSISPPENQIMTKESYVPYTPSNNRNSNESTETAAPSDVGVLNMQLEEPYSPQPVNEVAQAVSLTPTPPKYKPLRINPFKSQREHERNGAKSEKKIESTEDDYGIFVEPVAERKNEKNAKQSLNENKKIDSKKEGQEIPDKIDALVDVGSRENSNGINDGKQLRRSARSPRKKRPLAVECYHNLFGSDEDDGSVFASTALKTPARDKDCDANVNIAKKKRKRNNAFDCFAKDKLGMAKWLEKKRDGKETSNEKQPIDEKESTTKKYGDKIQKRKQTKPNHNDPDEIAARQQVIEELKQFSFPAPTEVEILTLLKISEADLLNSFDKYKSRLDTVFEKCKKRGEVRSCEGVNNCFVIDLIPDSTQLLMMNKLSEVYENGQAISFGTHFANALMPEWIICIFMDTYNFTRDEAIEQIKAQDRYRVHLNAESNHSLSNF